MYTCSSQQLLLTFPDDSQHSLWANEPSHDSSHCLQAFQHQPSSNRYKLFPLCPVQIPGCFSLPLGFLVNFNGRKVTKTKLLAKFNTASGESLNKQKDNVNLLWSMFSARLAEFAKQQKTTKTQHNKTFFVLEESYNLIEESTYVTAKWWLTICGKHQMR